MTTKIPTLFDQLINNIKSGEELRIMKGEYGKVIIFERIKYTANQRYTMRLNISLQELACMHEGIPEQFIAGQLDELAFEIRKAK